MSPADEWQPLSVRRGRRAPLGPEEGVPGRLQYPLRHWLEGAFGYRSKGGMRESLMMAVAMAADIPVHETYDVGGIMHQILNACARDEELFLDVIDATLALRSPSAKAPELERALKLGGSVWTVADDGKGLQRRVDESAAAAMAQAASPADSASEELSTAWTAIYGREPDPSDAWDHAIKAVEAVLIPLVVPKKKKATLGDVVGQLSANPSGWKLSLSSSGTVGSVGTLESVLRLMWPNPDRHGGGGSTRVPSQAEGEAVVQLAVLVVQWCRSGVLSKA